MLTETVEKTCLFTERLLLRVMTPEVYHLVFTTYAPAEIKAFFGITSDEALQREQSRYGSGIATWNRSFLYFQLIDKLSKEVIGWCGYHTWYLEHARAELGYGINSDAYKAQGLMSEALAPVLSYGFGQMGLNRIEAFVGAANRPSLALMRNFGFRQEGRLREHYAKGGRVEDSIAFALLKKEYEGCRTELS